MAALWFHLKKKKCWKSWEGFPAKPCKCLAKEITLPNPWRVCQQHLHYKHRQVHACQTHSQGCLQYLEERVPAAQGVWWETQQHPAPRGQSLLALLPHSTARQMEAPSWRWQQEQGCYREGGFSITFLLQATCCQQSKFQVQGAVASWKQLQDWCNYLFGKL